MRQLLTDARQDKHRNLSISERIISPGSPDNVAFAQLILQTIIHFHKFAEFEITLRICGNGNNNIGSLPDVKVFNSLMKRFNRPSFAVPLSNSKVKHFGIH